MRVQLLLAAMTAVVLANPAPQFGKGNNPGVVQSTGGKSRGGKASKGGSSFGSGGNSFGGSSGSSFGGNSGGSFGANSGGSFGGNSGGSFGGNSGGSFGGSSGGSFGNPVGTGVAGLRGKTPKNSGGSSFGSGGDSFGGWSGSSFGILGDGAAYASKGKNGGAKANTPVAAAEESGGEEVEGSGSSGAITDPGADNTIENGLIGGGSGLGGLPKDGFGGLGEILGGGSKLGSGFEW